MAQVDTGKTPTAAAGVAKLSGRVFNVRRISGREGPVFITIIRLPAADAFSSPATVELRSKDRIGQAGDDVNVSVRIGGYGRSYKATDPETGEQRVVQTADNSLTVVE